jgi:streptomycin 3"-adenylyltransferase
MMNLADSEHQVRNTTAALCEILRDNLVAVWLHGSALTGKLRPQSDIDLMVVVSRKLSNNQRDKLLAALLELSGPYPHGPDGPRCLEVIGFRKVDVTKTNTPTQADFLYGEWLRAAFVAGVRLNPTQKPDNTLILAQARRKSISLFGPPASGLLPEIPHTQVRRSMQEAIPELMQGLLGDERNVLLTLARMWYTASTGDFVSKDEAAAWALPQIRDEDAVLLDLARSAYLGEAADEWGSRSAAAQKMASHLAERVAMSA